MTLEKGAGDGTESSIGRNAGTVGLQPAFPTPRGAPSSSNDLLSAEQCRVCRECYSSINAGDSPRLDWKQVTLQSTSASSCPVAFPHSEPAPWPAPRNAVLVDGGTSLSMEMRPTWRDLMAALEKHLAGFKHAMDVDQVIAAAEHAKGIRDTMALVAEIQKDVGQSPSIPQDLHDEVIALEDRFAEVLKEVRELQNLLDDSTSDAGWTQTSDHGGYKTWFRKKPDSNCVESKSETVFAIPEEYKNDTASYLANLVALFNETDLMPNWYTPKGLLNSAVTVHKPRRFSAIAHLKFHFPWFLPLGKRETFLLGTGYDISSPEKTCVMIRFKSVTDQDSIPGANLSPTHNYTTICVSGAYYMELQAENGEFTGVLFRQIQFADLKLKVIPPSIINHISKTEAPRQQLANLSMFVGSFRGTEWDDRVKHDAHGVYGEIIRRAQARFEGKQQPSNGAIASAAAVAKAAMESSESSNPQAASKTPILAPITKSEVEPVQPISGLQNRKSSLRFLSRPEPRFVAGILVVLALLRYRYKAKSLWKSFAVAFFAIFQKLDPRHIDSMANS